MIDAREVRAELAKIGVIAHDRRATDEDKYDISRTGDQRTRNLMRLLSEFKL